MRVLVYGGRKFSQETELFAAMDKIHRETPISLLIEGGASGADSLARLWAASRGVEIETFPAQWRRWGNAAGPIRNQKMIDAGKPDLAVEFPGGAGTADMSRRVTCAGIPVKKPMEAAK